MGNFEDAEKAYTTALTAEGSALKENDAYMQSIEARSKALQQQFEQLMLKAPFEELEKVLLDVATNLLKFANSDIGQTLIQLAAVQAATMLFVKALVLLKSTMAASNIASFISLIASVAVEEGIAAAATGALTLALDACPLFWGAALVTGVVLLVKAISSLTTTVEEQIETLNDYNQTVKDTENECDALVAKIKDVEKAIADIQEKQLNLTNDEDIENLQKQEKELKSQEALLKSELALKEAQLKVDKERARLQAEKVKNTPVEYTKKVTDINAYDFGGIERTEGDLGDALKSTMSFVKEYEAQVARLENRMNQYKTAEQLASEEAKNYAEQLTEARENLADYEEKANIFAETIYSIRKGEVDLTEAQEEAISEWEQYNGVTDEATESNEEHIASARELIESLTESEEAAENYKDAIESVTSPLSEAESAFGTLQNAVKEFNTSGGFTAKTIQELSTLSEDWTQLLTVQNGQLVINQKALQDLADKTKEEAIANLQAQAAQDMMNAATGNFSELSPIAQTAISNLTSKTQTEAQEAEKAAGKEILLAAAIKARKYAAEEGGYGKATQETLDMVNAISDAYSGIIDKMNQWSLDTSSTAKSSAGSHKDAWVQAFEEEKDALKNLLETDQITQYEYYQRLAELNEKYFGEISGNHEKYIKEYRENEEEIYKGMKEVYDKVRDYLKEAVEQGYEKAINALKKEEKAVLAEIKKQIEAIKKEKEEVIKGIEKQIKALKKEKEAIEKYYNDQIDAIKRENEVLQEQNELLEKQQELQKAKQQKVMVMQNGRFSLTENESAVSQAEQNLSNYEDQLSYEQQIQQLEDLRDAQVETIEERIEALEEYKEYMEEYYDEQIEAMEEYYDQVQEQYELQIEALQEELDTFKDGYQKEEDLENARLAAQVLGMNERKDLYSQELENLKNYINEVNRMLASLGEAGVQVDFSYSPITGYHEGIAEVAGVDMALETRASGDASFGKDSVALVGESPNAELLLGSKVNTIGGGKLMHLQKGTGVVNAESTQTLAGLLNGLATPQTNVANNRSTQQNFSFGTISLPNVTDADSFVNTLSHKFNNYAIQYGNTRK